MMSLGVLIIAITVLAYVSNWINWRFLNYRIVRLLYFIGSFIHELSHAILCVLTGAKIKEFKVFTRQPRVVHTDPKIPLLGIPLISLAPLLGGLVFLYLINRFWLAGYFVLPSVSGWKDALAVPLSVLSQMNIVQWQSWAMIFLSLNVGAMLGPSFQDLKNFWPVLIVLLFVKSSFLLGFCYLVIGLVLTNIAIQIILIIVLMLFLSLLRALRLPGFGVR